MLITGPGALLSVFILPLATCSWLSWRGPGIPRGSLTGPRPLADRGADPGILRLRALQPLPRPSPVPPWLRPSSACLSSSLLYVCRLASTPQSLEDLEDQKRKKKKEKMGFGSISRVFARGKQRKSLDPGLFDGTAPDYYIEEDADW